MKGKTKTQKGITIIALIITIVVLLILAVVTIGAIKNDSIISYADNSATKYKDAQTKEEGILGYYESYLAGTAGKWTKNGDTITKVNNDGTKTEVKIGDTVTNAEVLAATGGTQSDYTGTWTVLGIENGRLKLVSTTNVTTSNVTLGKDDPEVFKKDEDGNPTAELKDEIVEIYNEDNLDLEKAIWSYQHAVETLDGHAKTKTGIESARSITIEDLEAEEVLNITNEDKGATYGELLSYKSGVLVDREGKIVVADSENEVTLDYNHYTYWYSSEQSIKFANSLSNGTYWLASRSFLGDGSSNALFSVDVNNRVSINTNTGTTLFMGGGSSYSLTYGVRAIVFI